MSAFGAGRDVRCGFCKRAASSGAREVGGVRSVISLACGQLRGNCSTKGQVHGDILLTR